MTRVPLILAALVAAGSVAGAATKPSPRPTSPASPSPRPSPRVYTEEDLKKAGGNVQVIGSPSASSTTEDTSREEDDAIVREKTWRARAEDARNGVTAAAARVETLQSKINALRSDLGQTDVMNPNREQQRQEAIAKAVQELDDAKAQLEAARKVVSDLEEEGRREGIPPGWLRP